MKAKGVSTFVLFILAFLGLARAGDPLPGQIITNSSGMKFAWIPPGTFSMGSPNGEKMRQYDEMPHKVTLTKGFYMGIYTVTQEQWTQIMGQNPSKFQDQPNLPVEQVNWSECHDFIQKLREKDNKAYRLPTESEWEYACRAGTTTPFYTGETVSPDQANYNATFVYGNGRKGIYRERTSPVGSFPPNPWGLYDMIGNVSQWCEDLSYQYPKGEVTDPLSHNGNMRTLRGGSWIDTPFECRSAFRGGSKPDLRHSLVGFRICFTPES